MAYGVEFDGANGRLGAPQGDEDRVYPLPVFRNGAVVVSCWELTEAEVEEIVKTKRIYLSLLSGPTMCPAVLKVNRDELRVFILDYGGGFKK